MRLADVVAESRYKPGWNLSLRTMHDTPHLWVTATVPNSEPPHEPTDIQHIQPAPFPLVHPQSAMFDDVEQHRLWVQRSLLGIEAHELGEWLWFGGERPFYPHHGPGGDPYAMPS